jgi:hypothetical protein
MYILQCMAGFPVPATPGIKRKVTVHGVSATVLTTSAASRLTLIDSIGGIQADSIYDKTMVDVKGVANGHGNIEAYFPEPFICRDGIAITDMTNLVQGSILVYVS